MKYIYILIIAILSFSCKKESVSPNTDCQTSQKITDNLLQGQWYFGIQNYTGGNMTGNNSIDFNTDGTFIIYKDGIQAEIGTYYSDQCGTELILQSSPTFTFGWVFYMRNKETNSIYGTLNISGVIYNFALTK